MHDNLITVKMAASARSAGNGADVRSDFERSAEQTASQPQAPSLPPFTNRGVTSSHNQDAPASEDVVFSVDWLTLTVFAGFDWNIKRLLDFLGLWEGLEDSGHGGTGFDRLMFGKFGFQVYADPRQLANVPGGEGQKTKDYFSLRFPGQCVQALGADRLVAFLEFLVSEGVKFKPTRLDLAFDTQLFTTAEIEDAENAGEIECRARKFKPEKDVDRRSGEVLGHTLYFGSRASGVLLRVYHKKDGHSFGDEPFTRLEMELHEDRAILALHTLFAGHISEWSQLAASYLVGFFSIKPDAPLAGVWSAFKTSLWSAWTRIQKAPQTLAKMNKWISRAVAPTLACVLMAKTSGDVDEMWLEFKALVTEGAGRLGAFKRALASDGGADIPDVLRRLSFEQVEF